MENQTKIITGDLFKEMVISGANHLYNNYPSIDKLNVFPVPDGDTGTNMQLTITNGTTEIANMSAAPVCDVAKIFARGLLMGARGNSGVLLSQIFRGVGSSLAGKVEANAKDFSGALVKGTQVAYKAVEIPTEGTILTVIRESSDELAKAVNADMSIIEAVRVLIAAAKVSLENTPNLLPVLKEAGVVDSGAAGLLKVMQGMELALMGTPVERNLNVENEEVSSCEVEDTAIEELKEFAIISTSVGKGLDELFTSLNVTKIVSGGQTMNPSTSDFIDAIKACNAKNIVILPNNKNIIMAAQQACEFVTDCNCKVVPTKTIPQGIVACMMYNPEDDLDSICDEMNQAIKNIKSGAITFSIKDTVIDGISIKKDHFMGLCDGKIKCCEEHKMDCAKALAEKMIDEDSAIVTIIYGEDVNTSEAQELAQYIEEKFGIEVELHEGDQPVYSYYISVE